MSNPQKFRPRQHPVAHAASLVATVAAAVAGTLATTAFSLAQAQTPAAAPQRIEVTGSLIKRIDAETASPLQVIKVDEIRRQGYSTAEELLRSLSSIDTSSIGDAQSSGFVNGLSTISQRGFGSQGTLVLINGRRIAPVAAVDINFGRGSLINVNTIPSAAIDRIEVLKDGASTTYGSDAMAGVVNYILKKDFSGLELTANYGANDKGVGPISAASLTFGMGNLDTQRFNLVGAVELSKRGSVMAGELKDRGDLSWYNSWLTGSNSALARFTPDSSASLWGSYYRVPASLAGSTTIDGRTVANNNLQGANYLGTYAGCPAERTAGQGVPLRPDGFLATTATLRAGFCRYNLDENDELISKQDRHSVLLRGTFAITPSITGFADVIYAKTKTAERSAPMTLTTALVSSVNQTAATYITGQGTIVTANAIVLPVTHPDNPTRGTATPVPVQVISRFEDLPQIDTITLEATRFTAGVTGSVGQWDFESALLYTKIDNERVWEGRLRNSLLQASIASGTYRFGQVNTAAALASVSTPALLWGSSDIVSLDVRAGRPLFKMGGGDAAIAVGAEVRREKLVATPDKPYLEGDFINVVANGASGSRDSRAIFGELRLPVSKAMELSLAARQENYSDFGNSTTGKGGFTWRPDNSEVFLLRGTAGTGFRAPGIPQIGSSFSGSFHNFQERRVFDNLRCDTATLTSRASPPNNRDCNVLGFTAVPAGTTNPGSIPSVISANPNLVPEESRSFTMGFVFNPVPELDFVVDTWYFHRKNEVRVKRGVDVMDELNSDPARYASSVLRDPNPATWLPGVPNSGPIVVLFRPYGNYQWTKTAGMDVEMNYRLPATSYGRFSVRLQGSYTQRFDVRILADGPISRWVGTSNSDIPKFRGQAQVNWVGENWSGFLRRNHADKVSVANTEACANGTAATNTAAANVILRDAGLCGAGGDETVDLGLTYRGIKNLTLSATVLNVMNDYGRSNGIPSVITYWDPGLPGQLGRRFRLNLEYAFK
jgi:iron complex outermembrane recepter protein